MLCSICGLPQGTHGIDAGTGLCWTCRGAVVVRNATGPVNCAPAQEEREMAVSLTTSCAECGAEYEIDKPHDCPMSLVRSLEQRWDRAFFAAMTGLSVSVGDSDYGTVTDCAGEIANETIRRHTELMAGRDAAIAEVVG